MCVCIPCACQMIVQLRLYCVEPLSIGSNLECHREGGSRHYCATCVDSVLKAIPGRASSGRVPEREVLCTSSVWISSQSSSMSSSKVPLSLVSNIVRSESRSILAREPGSVPEQEARCPCGALTRANETENVKQRPNCVCARSESRQSVGRESAL